MAKYKRPTKEEIRHSTIEGNRGNVNPRIDRVYENDAEGYTPRPTEQDKKSPKKGK